MKLTIANPYWDLYQQVKTLQKEHDPNILQSALVELSSLSRLSFLERSAVQFLIAVRLFANRLLEEKFFVRLREKYAYSAPSPKLLQLIAEHSPLIEIGAGNGYLASLLRAMGADIVALDAFPVEEGHNWFFNTSVFGLPTKKGSSWTTVNKGGAECLEQYSDRVLLLCWPPKNAMALESLTHFRGHQIILIANKSCCADAKFYDLLGNNWHLQLEVKTDSWSMCHTEVMEIYSRDADS